MSRRSKTRVAGGEASGADAAAGVLHVPFKPVYPPHCHAAVARKLPDAPPDKIDALALIYDEVVHRTINEMIDLARPENMMLHINVREDMTLELAQLLIWLGDLVTDRRIGVRTAHEIDIEVEREAALGPASAAAISGTARIVHDRIWSRKMEERWKPKSAKAIERETNPRNTKLPVKPVGKNHFIPRWFIRDLWAVQGKVRRWFRKGEGWASALRGFGEWGYLHNLYSDRLEAYFSLLEGDAKRPIEMLLDTRPLNGPQREALVGFLIIQLLRSPSFIEAHHLYITPVISAMEPSDDPWTPARAYEAIFGDNDFYHQLAHPVMWSRWAIVRCEQPVFVLPDTFGIRGAIGDGLRMIVPLTPKACFVTLPEREEPKRIVPRHLAADDMLARRISSALVRGATKEFLSHPDFEPDFSAEPESFASLLLDIADAVARRDDEDE